MSVVFRFLSLSLSLLSLPFALLSLHPPPPPPPYFFPCKIEKKKLQNKQPNLISGRKRESLDYTMRKAGVEREKEKKPEDEKIMNSFLSFS